ncbi:MAG: GNAT family N-acetyltransferase [bacterium]
MTNKRITLKPLSVDDARLIYDNREYIVSYYNGGISKKEFDNWNYENELESIKNDIEEIKAGKMASFTIFNENKEYIGKCMLNKIKKRNENASISVSIKERFWGKGYATEVVQALMKLAFEEYKLHRLEYTYYSINERSKKLAEKLGFKFEGIKRESKKIGDNFTISYFTVCWPKNTNKIVLTNRVI